MDKNQLKKLIEKTLKELKYKNMPLNSAAAVNLLLGTAAQESRTGKYIYQLNDGPALGIFQMERNTETDIWENYLKYNENLAYSLLKVCGYEEIPINALEGNLIYQICMARIHYFRVPQALPDSHDIAGLAAYWKKYYNTHLGAGTIEEFKKNYKKMAA